ncbi:MAG TPA: alpha/beta fold hydrolase, partial [Thermomicrobiales bacterium]|nr:alpha/beta fold hydrolase [Thermomicrobiales bacterium]
MARTRAMLREINGANLWVEEAGSGRAVVLVHSGITDCRMWDDQWIPLTRDCRVIRYDLRGHGRSSIPPAPFAHAEDLHALLNTLRIESAVLIAASMGGEVALGFALDYPDRVDGLVLVNTLAGMDTPSETLRTGWRAMEAAFDAGKLDEAVEIELRMWVDGPRRSPDQVDSGVRERVREMDFALLQRAE